MMEESQVGKHEMLIYDATFDAWRSSRTGHRVRNGDGTKPVQTRTLPVRLWPVELLHRFLFKEFRN